MLAFDVATLVFFVVATVIPSDAPLMYAVQIFIAAVIALDLAARYWICPNGRRFMREWTTWIDIAIITTLIAPLFIEISAENLAFLRVIRVAGIFRSFHVFNDLKKEYKFFKANEQVIQSAINLFVFIFVVAAIVYVAQHRINPQIKTFIDAIYFTVATLTTTGFGDITLVGDLGHLLAVLIMIVGISLFLRLLQTIFRPSKVQAPCPDCGLTVHESDASHCKHCGHVVKIKTSGEGS